MATAGAAKNRQVPDTPRFSPAQVAIALLRVAVGLHLPVDVPGQVLRSRLPHDRAWTHGGWTTWFLIRADQSPHGLKAADNVDSECPAQAVLVIANHP